MPIFSTHSLEKLNTCDGRLREICLEAIKIENFVVAVGYRGPEEQEKAFEEGKSKAHWGQSKHNKMPSLAVDLAPCDDKGVIDWGNLLRFAHLAGIVKGIAHKHGITIKWGGDWPEFKDYPHFEL